MPDPTMHCRLCPEVTPIEGIVEHVRLMHPDVWEGTSVTFPTEDIVTSTDHQGTSRFTAPQAGWYRFTRRLPVPVAERPYPRIVLPTALQRIGCEHPVTVEIGTYAEPHTHMCQNPSCGAVWQETEWRKKVWA